MENVWKKIQSGLRISMKDDDVIPKLTGFESRAMRKYDILDFMIIGFCNGIVFLCGLGVGWFLFCKLGVQV